MSVKRTIKKEIDIYKNMYPVIAVTGPRQSGKTTFLREEFPEYKYVNLENPDFRNYAEHDTNNFLKEYDKFVIIDEVQRVPSLFSYLQTKVDEDKIMGQYIISGSQNFHLMQNITQSLAGRVALFKLFPLDFTEMKSAGLLDQDYLINLHRGFYPAIFDRKIPSKTFYSNYFQTYVERDLSEIINIKDLKTFRNFVTLCAARTGQLLNLNSLANECGISQPTAKSWISVLESSYIIFLLQPYHSNLNKRVTKSPKLYFYDTGLLNYLMKISDPKKLILHPQKGSLFENFVIAEFIKNNYHKNLLRDFWFWRDVQGHEVDLIWQDDFLLNLIEIKASETIMPDMFKGLTYYDNLDAVSVQSKMLMHTGNFTQERALGKVESWINIDGI
jgi:hypothetical protein